MPTFVALAIKMLMVAAPILLDSLKRESNHMALQRCLRKKEQEYAGQTMLTADYSPKDSALKH